MESSEVDGKSFTAWTFDPVNTISRTMGEERAQLQELGDTFFASVGFWHRSLPVLLLRMASAKADQKKAISLLDALLESQVLTYGGYLIETEFETAIFELVSGAKDAPLRSSRRMLEIALLVESFHLNEAGKLNFILQAFKKEDASFAAVEHIAALSFNERLKFRSKYGKPSIGELANELSRWKTRSRTTHLPSLIMQTYGDLSKGVHLPATSYASIHQITTSLIRGVTIPYDSPLKYEKKAFGKVSEEIYRTIDLVGCLLVIAECAYLGVEPEELPRIARKSLRIPLYGPVEVLRLSKRVPNYSRLLCLE